jgi:hypothetical protein
MFVCILLQPQAPPGPYGQAYNAHAVQTPSLFPAQQPQTATKPLNSPAVPNFYPANPVPKPSIPQSFSPAAPPKPFSPAPAVPVVSQPHGGFANPGQIGIQAMPGAATQSGKFFISYLLVYFNPSHSPPKI